jgi:hypothetical protein
MRQRMVEGINQEGVVGFVAWLFIHADMIPLELSGRMLRKRYNCSIFDRSIAWNIG